MGQEDIFFAILRSIIWGTSQNIPSNVDWQGVLNLAARQKCLHAFSVWAKVNHIQTPYDKHLNTNVLRLLARHARLNQLTADVINLLAQHNIPATLIKGYSIAKLYPDPDMRDFGDVDIYVGEEHYHRAAELVTATFHDAHWHSDIRGGIHYIVVLDENMDRVVELHRVTMEFYDKKANALYQEFTHKHLCNTHPNVDINGTCIAVPSAAYNALYVFMHAWHHFASTGVGFRQLADWALSLHHAHKQLSANEWQKLCNEINHILSALHMTTAWQIFGYVVVQHLGLPAKQMPLYNDYHKKGADRLLKQLLRDGHGGRPSNFSLKDIVLMRSFPWKRPKKHRWLQLCYTVTRILFETCQMAKFFPSLAWYQLISTWRHSANKYNN